jgi:methionyl-tRNA formyltransferase
MENIVLYISGDRGVSVLQNLIYTSHKVAKVVTPGPITSKIDYRQLCYQNHIDLLEIDDVNAGYHREQLISGGPPNIAIICGFPTIFRKSLIDIPKYGTINLHAGKLPEYRGGSPLNWQLINGEDDITISIIQVDAGIDTGPVLAVSNFPISSDTDICEVHETVNGLFPSLVESLLVQIENRTVVTKEQNSEGSCYWHQRNIGDGRISWQDLDAVRVHNLVRAITRPYPGAFCFWHTDKVTIFKTSISEREIRGTPGHVCWVQGDGPYVICRDRAIRLEEYEIADAPNKRLPTGALLQDHSQQSSEKSISLGDNRFNYFDFLPKLSPSVQLVEQSFESNIFGRLVLQLSSTAEIKLADVRSICDRGFYSGVGLICCRVASTEDQTVDSLLRVGFRHVETLVTLEFIGHAEEFYVPEGIFVADKNDQLAICQIAEKAFSFDRFHADPEIEDHLADKLKSNWTANALRGRADSVFVAKKRRQSCRILLNNST